MCDEGSKKAFSSKFEESSYYVAYTVPVYKF